MEEEEQVGELLIRYYSNLFASFNPTQFDQVLNRMEPRASSSMNEELLRPFGVSEVQFALKQMDSDTAPGPDGLPPIFYKKFWSKVGHDISEAVLPVLNSGTIPNDLNHTFLTFIPKIHSPRRVIDFRPISLCNVLYKLVAKVLTNRLKPLLPKLISEKHSAFMSK